MTDSQDKLELETNWPVSFQLQVYLTSCAPGNAMPGGRRENGDGAPLVECTALRVSAARYKDSAHQKSQVNESQRRAVRSHMLRHTPGRANNNEGDGACEFHALHNWAPQACRAVFIWRQARCLVWSGLVSSGKCVPRRRL